MNIEFNKLTMAKKINKKIKKTRHFTGKKKSSINVCIQQILPNFKHWYGNVLSQKQLVL